MPQVTVKGACNVANTGNNNTITIKCGIDQMQARKMVEILNKILSNQIDSTKVIAKLDEILAQKQQSTQIINAPNGIAIGGGSVLNPTVNNYAPVPRHLDPSMLADISGCLASHPGTVKIMAVADSPEAYEYAGEWLKFFKNAGWTIEDNLIHTFMIGGGIWTGTHIEINGIYRASGNDPIYSTSSPGGALASCLIGKPSPDATNILLSDKIAVDHVLFEVGPRP